MHPDEPLPGPPFGRSASSDPGKLLTTPFLSVCTLPCEKGQKRSSTASHITAYRTRAFRRPFPVPEAIPDFLNGRPVLCLLRFCFLERRKLDDIAVGFEEEERRKKRGRLLA